MQEPPTTVQSPRNAPFPPSGGPVPPGGKPKVKKLRLAVLVLGLGLLALVSTVFGMMMAVSSDLPQLENKAEYKRSQNSVVYADAKGDPELAKLTGNKNRILLKPDQISPNIKNAVIAIEDRRFYEHHGVDYKGIARAFVQDVLAQSASQGGSTITQQFVKNALAAQQNRSVFQKLREAALAYHLERKWSKQKVLTEYLNSVYFGNGAYGVEAAVRTYFPSVTAASTDGAATDLAASTDGSVEQDTTDDTPHANDVTPYQAAMLAAIISSPSRYDPVEHPVAATKQRDAVLKRMRDQRMITAADYRDGITRQVPEDVKPPQPDSAQPYFTSWLTQQLVDRYRAPRVFSGGLKVKTTLDPELQASAEQAISQNLGGIGPSASLVAIENKTGEVKAMVGGTDFRERPFNLATNGHRQPGSSIKAFTLVEALEKGYGPYSTFTSQKKIFPVPNSKGEKFVVNNYEGSYSGVASLESATARSDNSVFAELGLKVGTKNIAHLAERMGIKTPVSTNPSMTLGGLKEGVTPLEMAYAYSTIANNGMRVSGTLDTSGKGGTGPVAIESVKGAGIDQTNKKVATRVFPQKVGEVAQSMLAGVVTGGTGKSAQIGEFAAGKTGTTENYGDAWFVGFNKDLTVAVWVGYPDQLKYMKTEYGGSPVAGGTFPTDIWHDFMSSWLGIRDQRDAERAAREEADGDGETAPSEPSGPGTEGGAATEGEGGEAPQQPENPAGNDTPEQFNAPETPTPEPTPTPTPAPAPGPPTGGGGSGGGATPN
jgi:penicillin-binding protein 1A